MKKPNCTQCTIELYQANRAWCDENCDFERSEEKRTCLCCKCGEVMKPECINDGDTICVDCLYEAEHY
jgi:hypothetical protein